MAVPTYTYGKLGINLAKSLVSDLSAAGSDIRVMLLANTYVPDQAGHDSVADVVANEITGTGYTAGGAALANKSVITDGLLCSVCCGV